MTDNSDVMTEILAYLFTKIRKQNMINQTNHLKKMVVVM